MPDRRVGSETRARAWADRWFLVLVAVGAVIAIAGGVLTAQGYLQSDTTVETRQVGSWESSGSFEHRATVVENVPPFDSGQVLENRSVYFQEASPVLDGAFEYSYEASDGGDLDVATQLVLVTQSVSRADEDETVLWRDEEVLASDRTASLSPGDTHSVPFSWNVTAARRSAATTDERLGTTGGETELYLESRVDVSGTRNGRSVDLTRRYRLPVTFESGLYRVDDPGTVTREDTQTEQVTVSTTPGPVERFGGPLATVAGIFGTLGLLLARYQRGLALDDAERERLSYRSTRQEFDEWITTVRTLDDVACDERVEVTSLEGLVDLAIDTGARVIEDEDTGRCLVARDDRCFVYDPPTGPDRTDTATDQSPTHDGAGATPTDGTSEETDDGAETADADDPDTGEDDPSTPDDPE